MRSLTRVLLATLAVLCQTATTTLLVSAGEIPVVDGVIGGVPHSTADGPLRHAAVQNGTVSRVERDPDPGVVRSPGQLRIVENSRICGQSSLLFFDLINILECRDDPGCVPRIGIRRYQCKQEHLVSGLAIILGIPFFPRIWRWEVIMIRNRFWYFDSRHDPHSAPLALWFNGGVSVAAFIFSCGSRALT